MAKDQIESITVRIGGRAAGRRTWDIVTSSERFPAILAQGSIMVGGAGENPNIPVAELLDYAEAIAWRALREGAEEVGIYFETTLMRTVRLSATAHHGGPVNARSDVVVDELIGAAS